VARTVQEPVQSVRGARVYYLKPGGAGRVESNPGEVIGHSCGAVASMETILARAYKYPPSHGYSGEKQCLRRGNAGGAV
jgi:hypothetical protein